MRKRITVNQVVGMSPCLDYTEARLLKLSGGKKSMLLLDVFDLPIPPGDIIWLFCEVMTASQRMDFAERCARHVLPIYEKEYPNDKRVRALLDGIRQYLKGKINDKELGELSHAASYAAAYASHAAARASYAAYAAYAARAADAAYAAYAADAADAAEQQWQLRTLKLLLKKWGESCENE